MRDNVETARDAGVNLAFFSGNTSCWQIRFEPSPVTGAENRVIVGYKDAAADPFARHSDSHPSRPSSGRRRCRGPKNR